MKRNTRIIPLVLVIMAVIVLLFIWILPRFTEKQEKNQGEIEVSGIIEAVETEIRSQTQGELKKILVEEGQQVKQGDLLCLLDSEKISLQLNQVQAAMEGARSKLRLAEKGTKKELIAVAKNQLESAEKELELARINQERLERLLQEGAISEAQKEEADLRLKVASERYESARENHELALRGREKEEIEMVEAEIRTLEAQGKLLLRQLKDSEVRAPSDGYLDIRHVEVGELASPGSILFSLIDPTRTYVKAYVPERYIGKVVRGSQVEVVSDSFPDRIFKGSVDFISDRAEFAPKDIQTKEERLKLVFMVKSYLDNPERELKPGMPVDVKIILNK